jgi:hypothetical protein
MLIGSQIAAAIEYGVAVEVREAQGAYETRLEAALEEIGRLGTIQSSMALKLTMRQIRTLRQRDRDENALAIFRTNFPEFEYKPDEEVRQIITELNDIERKAGRAELMKTKIMKSNIHTVLKPLDHEWNSRFGMGLMQMSPSIVQKRANDLLTVRVESPRQFDVWQGKVFELFVDALVFNGYAGRDTKPVGTVDPGQLRLYRRNWSEWCEKNSYTVLEFASRKTIEELTKDRTRNYNINAELRRQTKIQQSLFLGEFKRGYKELQQQKKTEVRNLDNGKSQDNETLSSASNFKVCLRLVDNFDLSAERVWNTEEALKLQLMAWVDAIRRVWGATDSPIRVTLESNSSSGVSRVEFLATFSREVLEKISAIVVATGTSSD